MKTSNIQHPTSNTQSAGRARYLMIGGFLGAGKTTAVAALAQHLTASGLRVGLITNDQGSELVDTAMLRARGFATEEIPGGCFCCRFNSLVDAAARLTQATLPEAFIAEPVGSCTDLVATVTYPLRRMYGDQFVIAPLSVLVDPVRAERVFGLAGGGQFSEKVLYIYRKQLEEADLIVITKTDLLEPARLDALRSKLASEFPHAEILAVSVRENRGVEEWFARLTAGEQQARATMDVDYELYAEGEALLGWLNATVQLVSDAGFDADAVLQTLARDIQHALAGAEIAHLKMTLSPDTGLGDIAVINLVRSDFVPELSLRLEAPVTAGQLIINCRAEATPEALRDAVRNAVAALPEKLIGLTARLDHLEYFRPGKPQPTHRDALLS
jgi:G3E family GTPase